MRRACLDFVIPLSEKHLYDILKGWVLHYNESRVMIPLSWISTSHIEKVSGKHE